jgi:hypothetical protein
MAWTKADYDAAYLCRVDRYFNRDNPEVAQDPAQTSEVLLHYHRFFMRPILASMWARLAPILNIAATENVLIIGAGFGWGVEAFIAETGCTTVGIDVSDYIGSWCCNQSLCLRRAAANKRDCFAGGCADEHIAASDTCGTRQQLA